MAGKQLSLRCVQFDPLEFERVVAEASRSRLEDIGDQVRYLAAYLSNEDIGTRTLLIEAPYVDRHYIEEYAAYYATCFQPPDSSTTRIHALACKFEDADITRHLDEAATGSDRLRQLLEENYLGFVVVRPLPSAPIGRTILTTYRGSVSRIFGTSRKHYVHLLGQELVIRGVPFQQQETAVGACATTSLWSALASVARASGGRAPTPHEITVAATQYAINDRPIPAQGGLDVSQVLAAVRSAGFSPLAIKASSTKFGEFGLALKCYLASGIPVILMVQDEGGFHAMTAIGYRTPDEERQADDLCIDEKDVRLVSAGMVQLYVHEDRLGPYARMVLSPRPAESPQLRHVRFSNSNYHYSETPMTVYAAIVPLYPKLRLTASGLMKIAAGIFPLMRSIVGIERAHDLRIELSFRLCGDYTADLFQQWPEQMDTAPLIDFVTTTPLPRYVGILRFSIGVSPLGDIVCDTTDIERDQPKFGGILGLIPFAHACVDRFHSFTQSMLKDAGPKAAVPSAQRVPSDPDVTALR